ncbi:MAG: MotA/TolQ/ExbB proton channel family protein [Smithellaceae bacterium]|jgi:chemotaxis protein MotA
MIRQTILSLFLLVAIFLLAFNLGVQELGMFSNLSALMIVLGGTLCATLLAYPCHKLIMTAGFLKNSFSGRKEMNWTIDTIVHLARVNKKKDIRLLEQEGQKLPPGLIKTGIELIAYRFTRENIEQLLHKEALAQCGRYETAHKILCSMAKLAPAMGLAGTIVNLIRVYEHISNPQSLMGYMAVALMSTFYGVVIANVCFVPLANKLREFIDQDLLRMEIILEGILDIYDHENPQAIRYKMETLAGLQTISPAPRLRIATPLPAGEEMGQG